MTNAAPPTMAAQAPAAMNLERRSEAGMPVRPRTVTGILPGIGRIEHVFDVALNLSPVPLKGQERWPHLLGGVPDPVSADNNLLALIDLAISPVITEAHPPCRGRSRAPPGPQCSTAAGRTVCRTSPGL
jgi:hypothetical protein